MRIEISNTKSMQKEIYFISDAHVGSRDTEAEELKEAKLKSFFNFLTTISPPPILYIVGDLFDFWFEYRFAIPSIYQKLLASLGYLSENGIEIRYVTGNHDFWMGNFFPKYMNINVYHGIHNLKVNSKSFYIYHGDGVLKADRGYRLLKRIIQNPLTIMLYKLIHPDVGIPIARWSSAKSRNNYIKDSTTQKSHDESYITFAGQILKSDYDYILMGHTHRPIAATDGTKTYLNLGDWISNFTFARYDGKKLGLYRWTKKNDQKDSSHAVEIKPVLKQFE